MTSRKVLTVNQVFEIMVKWLDYRDWEKAFMEVIPERKLKDSTLLNQEDTDDEDDEEEETIGKNESDDSGEEQQT